MPRSSTRTAFAGNRESALALKTFVIDTSVLLSDPHALRNFAEHNVVVPIVVITELEAKRHHPELGYFARTALRGKGRPVPMINPLRWLVISEIPDVWTVGEYRIGKGMGNTEYMMKYRSTSAKETGPFLALPEVRRLLFHSYIVTAEKKGTMLIFSDPLRISGRIFYPPHHMCVCVPLPDPSSLSGHSSNSLKSNPE